MSEQVLSTRSANELSGANSLGSGLLDETRIGSEKFSEPIFNLVLTFQLFYLII